MSDEEIDLEQHLYFLTNLMSNEVAWQMMVAHLSAKTGLSQEKVATILNAFYDELAKRVQYTS
jgi:hypothetical protein